jgi:hypothetical protein
MSILRILSSVPFELHLGDPTLLGWLTVAFYLGAAAGCLATAWFARRIFNDGRAWVHQIIWLGLAAILFFLGMNKQLDLQSWFTAVVKAVAWEQGWYAYGQRAQVLFLAGFGLVGITAVASIGWLVMRIWRHYLFVFLGLLVILRFIVVRIGTFYAVPLPELSQFTGGFRINGALELIGAAVIALTALNNLRHMSTAPQPDTPALEY